MDAEKLNAPYAKITCLIHCLHLADACNVFWATFIKPQLNGCCLKHRRLLSATKGCCFYGRIFLSVSLLLLLLAWMQAFAVQYVFALLHQPLPGKLRTLSCTSRSLQAADLALPTSGVQCTVHSTRQSTAQCTALPAHAAP